MRVVVFDETIDRGPEISDGSEHATFETSLGEGDEEALDGIERGGQGRSEVEGPARMARDPLARGGMHCMWAA